jgi:ectoine hydroxylase-related dioxygenase (phytanoyl-CoA dioxygenase family)
VAELARRFDAIARRAEPLGAHWSPQPESHDPTLRHPRVHQAHEVDPFVRALMLRPQLARLLEKLMGEPALAVQAMYYFKPPGARGQAIHQDSRYLLCEPQPCVAVWIAVDPATAENGALALPTEGPRCPRLLPMDGANDPDAERAMFDGPMAEVALAPGDAVAFDGLVPHGSGPNRAATVWRRSLVLHYVPRSTRRLARWYGDVLAFDGSVVEIPRVAS